MNSTPDKDNFWRFGDPDTSLLSDEEEDEVEFDVDVDDVDFDSCEDEDE